LIPFSVVLVTKNEERNIVDALESVKDFEDIVVVDAFSDDMTVDICRRYTDRVYRHAWEGYALQKQKALDYATREWVFLLDADERITPELKTELTEITKAGSANGFYVPRKNYFLGKWIRHGGWWPDYTLRFFRKDRGRMEPRAVHERVVVEGSVPYLKNPVEHYTYRTISEYILKMERYSDLAARELISGGGRREISGMIVNPCLAFVKMFLVRQGFRDGMRGFLLAALYSFYTFLKYAKAWEKRVQP